MKLSLLEEREPFSDIFIKTLKNYLLNVSGWEGEIKWSSGRGIIKKDDWLVNSKLNIIYGSELSRDILYQLTKEYAFNPNVLLRILQGIYVKLAINDLLRPFFVDSIVRFSKEPKQILNCSIIGGNRTVRIINFKLQKCIVLHKIGYPKIYFNNQIWIRKQFAFLPIPKLYNHSIEQGWFEEELVKGLPINRIGSFKIFQLIRNNAFNDLLKLYYTSKIDVDVDAWLGDKLNQINDSIDLLPNVYDSNCRSRLYRLVQKFTVIFNNEILLREYIIFTSITHGDFQMANILYEDDIEKKYYIIDWEFAQRRIYYYDAMVFYFESRQPAGLASRLNSWLNSVDFLNASIFWCNIPNNYSARFILVTFLIEELLFRIQDSTIPGLFAKQDGLLTFIKEMDFLEI
jgi:hypothetical protein